jgi:P pilus assembly chaperone PapD
MKIIHRFTLCLGAALFLLAACEGGFVEPKGRLIVKNQSASAITSVQTQPSPPLSSVWFERWTGHAEQNSKITLKLDPGVYDVRITVDGSDKENYTCDSVTVPEGEQHLIFDGEAFKK